MTYSSIQRHCITTAVYETPREAKSAFGPVRIRNILTDVKQRTFFFSADKLSIIIESSGMCCKFQKLRSVTRMYTVPY